MGTKQEVCTLEGFNIEVQPNGLLVDCSPILPHMALQVRGAGKVGLEAWAEHGNGTLSQGQMASLEAF